ncbi:hypothetical protein [Aquiflexum sp.]|uniref:hypothetical protein n=1 Tax=Aquiflexum sp. TaxID=1872584 RepID=UPI0035942583
MNKIFLLFVLFASVFSCNRKTEYDKVKEEELASGKVVNELFLDLQFGMDRKSFYGTCWEHNKNGILINGPHHLQILYKPEMPSGKTTDMFFYPQFEEDKLVFMPMEFFYTDWFPNTKEFSSEELKKDVVALLETWYGPNFFEVTNKDKTISAMVKIDGNRLIRVFKKNLTTVRVEIIDLNARDIINKKDDG